MASDWRVALQAELDLPYFRELLAFVRSERETGIPIYPPHDLMFNALRQTPLSSVKVVIVGQDPYHGRGQAHGLSFSVPPGVEPPPSLRNIFKELQTDLHLRFPTHGCLLSWAQQGVLLLNATLTVRDAQAKSHHGRGWERFTDAVLSTVLRKQQPVVFLLWGQSAKEKLQHLPDLRSHPYHLVLTAAHPSPLSAYNGFFGCGHFSKTNRFLEQHSLPPIDWQI